VNELLARAGSFFLAPAASAARPAAHAVAVAPPPPARAAVLACAPDLPAASGMLAAALRSRHGAAAAVVCLPSPPAGGAPASPAASAVARRLSRRDLECTTAGVVCRVHLPSDPAAFVVQAWRVLAAADVPAVVAIPRREAVHDELLAGLDLVALATGPDADATLADVAVYSLERIGVPVARLTLPRGALARRAAAGGLVRAAMPRAVAA
jgi:hypothetical protein